MIWADETCQPLTAPSASRVNYDNRSLWTRITNPFTFTGRRYDPETALYYYRARYNDPKLGRFISRDPIGFEGSEWNLYEYVGGMPLIRVDVFGLYSIDLYLGHGESTTENGSLHVDKMEEPPDEFFCLSCNNTKVHDKFKKKFPCSKVVDGPVTNLEVASDLANKFYDQAMNDIQDSVRSYCDLRNNGDDDTVTLKITCGPCMEIQLNLRFGDKSPCGKTFELPCPGPPLRCPDDPPPVRKPVDPFLLWHG